MGMFKIAGLVAFVVGIALLVFGIDAMNKAKEKTEHNLTGHYSDKTVWYVVTGIALIVGGAGVSAIRRQ